MFFDSHCHLTADVFHAQLEDVLQRAHASAVTRVLNIGDTLASSQAATTQIAAAREHGIEMLTTVGIHPQNALQFDEASIEAMRELASHSQVVAIGEIGLDYVYDDNHEKFPGASRATQEAVLRAQLDLAQERDLPVVIHNRDADEELLRILSDYRSLRGVFHCFSSAPDIAERVLNMGFYLGFTGIITFKNAEEVRASALLCPRDRVLIETDAPYLAPVPHRGKTNEPAWVPLVAAQLAQLYDMTLEEIARLTTNNALRLFAVRSG